MTRNHDPLAVPVHDRLLAGLLERSSQPFVMADMTGRLVHGNRAFQELVGYSEDELLEINFRELTPDRWKPLTEEVVARVLATGTPERYEKAYTHKDGHEVPVELAVDLYRDEAGRPLGSYGFVTDISERKRAEAALRESEARFRRLYDEAPFGYHEIDPDGVIQLVNRTECEMLGYTREEMLGRPIFDFAHPSLRAIARRAVIERIRGEQPVAAVERVYVTKDGREINVHIENRLNRSPDGSVIGLRSTVQDITWRKQAEAARIASERRTRALFEGIEDAIFVHDVHGRILDANQAACRRLGYTREELLRLSTADIDDPTFAAGYEDRLEEQLRQGHLRIEGRHRTKGGRTIPVDINSSTIQLEDETVILAVIRDITERKALEETRRQFAEAQLKNAWEIEAKNRQLSQSEARYRQLTEGCLDAIVVTDESGRITLFNASAERAFGYTAAEARERAIDELFAPGHREALMAGLAEYARSRTGDQVGRTIELKGLRKDGSSFPLELSLSAIDNGGVLQFMGAIRDQTERQRMRAVLMQSEKLASIGLLSAGVAHEINNPLAYVANNLAVLERDLEGVRQLMSAHEAAESALPPEEAARMQALAEELDWPYVRDNLPRLLSRTRDGVQRVANIVQNLRGFARSAPQKLEQAYLADLAAGAIDMVQGRLRRGQIEVRLENDARAKLDCVPSQIGQVVLNLLMNAIQAVEEARRPDGNLIRIVIRELPDAQAIEFIDQGVGIPAEALPRLFDPFFTTKPVGEGTGLGLSISHGIVTGHGGTIEVESTPEKGSTFRVLLPLRNGP